MKTIYRLVLCLIISALFAGCEKADEAFEGLQYELAAKMESSDETKTSLSDLQNGMYYPLWSVDDRIAVYCNDDSQPAEFKLQSGEGTTEAMFAGKRDGENLVALYPFDENAVIKNGFIEFTLPANQQYTNGSFAQGAYPMVAKGGNGVLNFKNLCSVLKISLYGKGTVKSITLTANDKNTYLSGKAAVSTSYSNEPELVMSSGGNNYVILECVTGLELTSGKEYDFFIVIPAQTYKGGFTVSVKTIRGTMEKVITNDVVFERSQIRELESFEFKMEGDIDPSESLQGEGTQESPFLIKGLADLLLMQKAVNSPISKIVSASTLEEVDARTAHYKLMADISLSSECGEGSGNWQPVGNYAYDETYVFGGVFDGNGYSVRDLYIESDKRFQGLFGCLSGRIKNLSVYGTVIGNGCCGIICGGIMTYNDNSVQISDCASYGTVESGDGYIDMYDGFGGIAGEGANMINCTNYATVNVTSGLVGGITGSSSLLVDNCTNYGNVKGYRYVGGISGYQNAGRVANSCNMADVSGVAVVGGVSGYIRQKALMTNSFNTGEVEGAEKVGGVVGMCDTYSDVQYATKVRNCVNTGNVKSSSGTASVGGVCGYNVSEITNCYWLCDGGVNTGINTGVGESSENSRYENVVALTAAQMKGNEDYEGVLYISNITGSTSQQYYYNVLDALNAFAYDNTTPYIQLNGWKYSGESGYPVLNGGRAEKPDGADVPVFEVSIKEVTVPFVENTLEVVVKSNTDYYISSVPHWITDVTAAATKLEIKTVVHKFKVAENTGTDVRRGVIVFCNENQQCIPVSVTQNAKGADDEWIGKELLHKSLGMRFTADWCGFCPMMATAFEDAVKQLQDKLVVINLHADGGLYSQVSQRLANQYNVEGFPTGYVDSRVIISNNGQTSYTTSTIVGAVEETEEKFETVTGASWSSALSGNKVTLDLKVYFKVSDSYKVTALLVEDNIVAYQAGASDNYVHNDVVRAAFTNALGEEVSAVTGQILDKNYTIDIPEECNKENLKIVVYVQKKAYDGGYYVNNAASAAVGKQQPLLEKSGGMEN